MQNGKPMDQTDGVLDFVCEKLKEAERDIAEGRIADAKHSLEMLRRKYEIKEP